MQIGIVTNIFGKYHRQDIAIESWIHLKKLFQNDVKIFNLQFKDESSIFENYNEDIDTRFVLESSSKDYIENSTKKLPLIYELIEKGFQESQCDYVLYTNSDVILLPRLIEYIKNEKPDCITGPRLDIEDIDSYEKVLKEEVVPIRNEIAGYDFFCFSKEWWNEFKNYFSSKFFIGKPMFDVVYAGLIVMFGKKYLIANDYPMMALHIHHGTSSVTSDCPERDFNLKEYESNVLFKIADNIMFFNLQYNLCRRTPWGQFIQPQANERQIQKAFFDTMNIHSENKIKYIT